MDFTEFAQPTLTRGGTVKHGTDENLLVEFYMESVLQEHESEKQGRPIYKDVPFIWIRFPGDRTRERRRKVDMIGKDGAIPDPDRFPRQWSAFQRKHVQVQEGTPIEQWGPISKSQALTYKGLNIHTVENLAGVPDSALHSIGHGARALRDKAIAWLKSSKDSAETLRLAAENQTLRDDIAVLKEQVAELATKRKPGRPRKEETEDDQE